MIVNLPSRPDKLDSNTLAASLTGFHFEVVPGMPGEDVPWKSLPKGYDTHPDSNGTIGAYRSLLNAVRSVVERRLTTALILEDDTDWDVDLKTQLFKFALGSRYLVSKTTLPYLAAAQNFHSPYGDYWDVLNLGHCTSGQHRPSLHDGNDPPRLFRISDDPTVPPPDHVSAPFYASPSASEWVSQPGRRLVYRGASSCSWAHAVSFRGAQKMLDRMSVEPFSGGYDNGVQGLCQAEILDCIEVRLLNRYFRLALMMHLVVSLAFRRACSIINFLSFSLHIALKSQVTLR
jgi:hypothetical protein